MAQPNVLRVNPVEEQASYRSAVSQILLNIQRDHDQTLLDIAEAIGVSLGTISNAANRKCDLSPTYLKRLGQAYGPHALDPYAALVGGRVVPLEADEDSDALPAAAAVVHKLALAMSPDSPGGVAITHGEMLDMEREIDAALSKFTALKMRCNQIRMGIAA